MKSASLIARLVAPSASRSSTSRSRGVSRASGPVRRVARKRHSGASRDLVRPSLVVSGAHLVGLHPDLDEQLATLVALAVGEEVLGQHEPRLEGEEGAETSCEVDSIAQSSTAG